MAEVPLDPVRSTRHRADAWSPAGRPATCTAALSRDAGHERRRQQPADEDAAAQDAD